MSGSEREECRYQAVVFYWISRRATGQRRYEAEKDTLWEINE